MEPIREVTHRFPLRVQDSPDAPRRSVGSVGDYVVPARDSRGPKRIGSLKAALDASQECMKPQEGPSDPLDVNPPNDSLAIRASPREGRPYSRRNGLKSGTIPAKKDRTQAYDRRSRTPTTLPRRSGDIE